MIQDEIIRMAREAGFVTASYDGLYMSRIERFAALVAAHEREKQAEQEPVAAYRDAPRTIYLQTGCDDPDPFECGCSFNEWGDVSWCAEKIHDTDIPYIRADYTRPVRTKDLTDEEAVAAAYKGFDDYWTEDCKGIEAEAWLASARAVIAAYKTRNK